MSISVKKNWWETLFDEIYLLTDARSVCDDDITRREVDLMCRLLSISEGQRIVDLCGGHGRHCFEFYSRGFERCTLVDYSRCLLAKAAQKARENGADINIIQADARKTGLLPGQFDRVCILGNSLGYISETDADSKIIREAWRLLRRGGRALVDVADGEYVLESFAPRAWHEIEDDTVVCRERELREGIMNTREMVLDKKRGLVRDECYSIRLFDERKLMMLLEKAGFSEVEIRKDFSAHDRDEDYGFMNNRMLAIGVKA